MNMSAFLISLSVYVILGVVYALDHVRRMDNFYLGTSGLPLGATVQSTVETFLLAILPTRILLCAIVYYGVSYV
jgi:xanthosine utilization system XapX-like protein